jgi:phosphohistidine phosphatase
MDLYVLRHGEAGKSVPVSSKDFERKLTESGRKRIESIGKSLKERKIDFDSILTSPLPRAKETASIVAKVLGFEERLEECNELKPEGNRLELYKKLAKMKSQSSVLVVGHEPYLTILIGDIISGNPNSHISLKKGGLAKISIEAFLPRISGELKWLLTPKQVTKI